MYSLMLQNYMYMYVLIAYTITISALHLTHKIHSDKLCVVPYIDIDHVQLFLLPNHTLC